MLAGCGSQLRVGGLGQPFALDFGAVMLVGQARGADTALLAELLPATERAILQPGGDSQDEEDLPD